MKENNNNIILKKEKKIMLALAQDIVKFMVYSFMFKNAMILSKLYTYACMYLYDFILDS